MLQLSRRSHQFSASRPTLICGIRSRKMSCAATLKPFTIVGAGRVGLAIAEIGGSDVVIRRGEPVVGLEAGPILVCTRNDDLEAVVQATPPDRRQDLVFLQNGMLQPWLDAHGLGGATQLLVYFAVAKKGDKPVDGVTDVNPEGLTAACGPHAEAVAERLKAGGLTCKVLHGADFTAAMLDKLVWISAFMLLGVAFGENVGQVESRRKQELAQLIAELSSGGAAELGIATPHGCFERLLAYGRSVAHYPTAVKEFSWRNGWFHAISQRELAAGRPDPFPYHSRLLLQCGLPA